jgi:hypothetical protein
MSVLFELKQGALLPEIELTLAPSGYTYNLADATAIEFRYRKLADSEVESIALTIIDAPTKTVRLTPTVDLTDTVGTFECHVKVTMPVGKPLYFPQKTFDKFKIKNTL